MNKINQLFQNASQRKLLSLYFCAGCPDIDNTADVIKTMQRRGIDMIEVGMPFSDPLADGPVIQSAGTVALKNGMTLDLLLRQLAAIKDEVTIPLVLMGFLNPVMHMGYETYFSRCAESGISGTIIPDLPFDDYLNVVKPIADRYDIRVIMMITPETGAQNSFDEAKLAYFNRINNMHLRNPRMIGFGISNKQTLESAQQNAAGAIIGSKFVTLLRETGNANQALDALYEALQR